jgi:AmmeMemoRadiSam system protein B
MSESGKPLPPLRHLDMFPAEQEGQQVIVLRDPAGVFSEMIALPIPAFFIVSCFNGTNRIPDVQAAFLQQFGQRVRTEDVQSLAERLDEYLLLYSPRFDEKRKALEADYGALPVRPACHAGQAYPDNPEALRAAFEAYFTLDGGAGMPGDIQTDRRIAGLVLPHMDPRCSGACASWGLRALAESPKPDVFVVLGTAHQPIPRQYSLSDKDYDTPLGPIACDKDFIDRLRREFGAERISGGELVHKAEHSIEFQAMFLRALYEREPNPPEIVPILCGSFHEMVESGQSPADSAEVGDFSAAMRRTAEDSGKSVCYISGADLAHMGRKFGDEEGVSDALIDSVRRRDLEMLAFLERADAEGFYRHIEAEKDARKICGMPPMFTMMKCMDASAGKLLRYDYNIEAATDSLVSFCAMAFYF